MLAGPAFAVMLLVTAYPIVQAIYESLFDFRLTDPDNRAFNGLGNYAVILTANQRSQRGPHQRSAGAQQGAGATPPRPSSDRGQTATPTSPDSWPLTVPATTQTR